MLSRISRGFASSPQVLGAKSGRGRASTASTHPAGQREILERSVGGNANCIDRDEQKSIGRMSFSSTHSFNGNPFPGDVGSGGEE